jgi:hypothetical protein
MALSFMVMIVPPDQMLSAVCWAQAGPAFWGVLFSGLRSPSRF